MKAATPESHAALSRADAAGSAAQPAGLGEAELRQTLAALEAQTRSVAAGAREGGDDEAYSDVLRQLEEVGGDPGMASVLDAVMSQLLSKAVLYEPLQQISERARVCGVHVAALLTCFLSPVSLLPGCKPRRAQHRRVRTLRAPEQPRGPAASRV